MKPTLLVLAAGMGSRYGSLKQIEGIGPSNETIIDYSIYDAIRAGFGKIVFVIRRDIEKDFKEIFGNRFNNKIKVEYAFQELTYLPEGFSLPEARTKPWGTSHAVMMAKDIIKEPFAVINADDFYGAEAFYTMAKYLSSISEEDTQHYCMIGYNLKNTLSKYGSVSRGICQLDNDGFLSEVVERTHIEDTETGIVFKENNKDYPLTGQEIVSMNFWGFTPSYFEESEAMFKNFLRDNNDNPKSEFFIPLVVNNLTQNKKIKLKVLNSKSVWFGVTYQEDKPNVQSELGILIDKNIYPKNIWK
ncbi:MAG: sugar phosphate nucleotidyltransferase [Bacteroidales bacterium]|nr:sugar phosphate nucleotidyltransferase [Bacteroidales bacterium]